MGFEIVFGTPDGTRSLCGQVELVLVYWDIVLILGLTYHRLKNYFGQMMELLGDVDQMEAHFGPFGDSANLNAR
jgi:hypothetical protein